MSDTIKLGNLEISSFKVGSSDCKIYLGSTLLYPSESPTPSFKWKATYTGGTTSSAQCDSTSAISYNEIVQTDLVAVEIGDCVTSIGSSAFGGCSSLTSVTIPNSVTIISGNAFSNCTSLTSVTIPDSVTSIGYASFFNCTGITSINIPDNVTLIDGSSFSNCSGLTSVNVGTGVTSIGGIAFQRCSNLTSFTIHATTPPTLGTNAFRYTNIDLKIYVPSGSVSAYKSSWSSYSSKIHAIPSS